MFIFLFCCFAFATRSPPSPPCSSCPMFRANLSAHSASVRISISPFLCSSPPRSFLRGQSSLLLLRPCTTHPPSSSLSSHPATTAPLSCPPPALSTDQQGCSLQASATAGQIYLPLSWKQTARLSPAICALESACLSVWPEMRSSPLRSIK